MRKCYFVIVDKFYVKELLILDVRYCVNYVVRMWEEMDFVI